MNIYLLTETESGCYKWRAAIPAKYLRRRGHTVQIFGQPECASKPDVLVFFRGYVVDAQPLYEWCRRLGIRVVFDTDDALDLVPPENANYHAVREGGGSYDFLLRRADLVTTTTEELAGHLRQHNPNVVVLPNSVDPEEWHVPPRREQLRVGWSGSCTHFMDLAMVLDAVRELHRHRDFRFVLQGICNHASIQEFYDVNLAAHGRRLLESGFGRAFQHFLKKLRGMSYEFHPSVEVGAHARQVSGLALDIGIAPLLEGPFNRHKSCIKYYEYAMSGAVTLASRTLPYLQEAPLLVKNNQRAWREKLEWLLDADRQRLWREQREWVLEHRNMQRNVRLWEQAYTGDHLTLEKDPPCAICSGSHDDTGMLPYQREAVGA